MNLTLGKNHGLVATQESTLIKRVLSLKTII